jgi:hypothetical protein
MVTHPCTAQTLLVKNFDRDKRLFAFNNRMSNWRPGLEPQGHADTRHLNCHSVACNPDGEKKCGASSAKQSVDVDDVRVVDPIRGARLAQHPSAKMSLST